jgi:kinesin family protein 22
MMETNSMLTRHAQISKAVEMEVARRLEERERERGNEEEARRSREQEQELQRTTSGSSRSKSRSPKKEQTLPPGVLTPLLRRHRDLDDELQHRLQELERKLYVLVILSSWQTLRVFVSERGNKEVQLADVLSPVSKKKTGRAYVALARAHSEKCAAFPNFTLHITSPTFPYRGDLQVALDLYRKAESYVPDNVKLKERWILFVIHVFLCNITHGKEQF